MTFKRLGKDSEITINFLWIIKRADIRFSVNNSHNILSYFENS